MAEKVKFKLAWQVKELEDLIQQMRKLVVDISMVMSKVQDDQQCNLVNDNVAKQLGNIRGELSDAIKRLSKHKRTVATHIFVFMISPEKRNFKPYGLPIQCLPIRSLKDKTVRDLANKSDDGKKSKSCW